jgi:hypothetical protein
MGVLELAKVNGQVALGGLKHGLELVEIGDFDIRQIGHDPEAHPPVDDLVQLADVERGHLSRPPPPTASSPSRAPP